ncbi:MAG: tetratricopeptide repeat protein [Telluria sp.]
MTARILLLISALLLGGCATSPIIATPHTAELVDDSPFQPATIDTSTDKLFALSPAMKAYMQTEDFRGYLRNAGLEVGLVQALYDPKALQLSYDTSVTRNAAETFDRKAGNCLSLAIMTAAFAKELGLTVHYQMVMIDETWTRSQQLYMSNMHVNLVIGHYAANTMTFNDGHGALIVDFLPAEDVRGFRVQQISDSVIVGMYLNNRAVEELSDGHVDNAYWLARKAVLEHPQFPASMNTLGVIYTRKHEPQLAERAFRMALEREPKNLSVMYNLLALMKEEGRTQEASLLASRVSELQAVAPFAYFEQGLKAMDRGDYAAAREMFKKEVDRSPYYDEFHYWLAVADLRLGDPAAARKELELAVKNSTTVTAKTQYSAKLAHIKSLRGSDQ